VLDNEINFQADSKRTGDEYEKVVLADLINRGFTKIEENVHIVGTGCEVDFVAQKEDSVVEYVEAKGGQKGPGKRPGAKRTDNVKKAIANAALIKSEHPDYYYVIYFSSKPKPKSYSDEMIQTALKHGIVNEVRYERDITYIIRQMERMDQV
jgi:Holliday junction resolvase-like predicted endonuclease